MSHIMRKSMECQTRSDTNWTRGRGSSVVELQTPEREVQGANPTTAV